MSFWSRCCHHDDRVQESNITIPENAFQQVEPAEEEEAEDFFSPVVKAPEGASIADAPLEEVQAEDKEVTFQAPQKEDQAEDKEVTFQAPQKEDQETSPVKEDPLSAQKLVVNVEEAGEKVAEPPPAVLKKEPAASRSKGGPVIIILVNPKSGGNAAGTLLNLPSDGHLVKLDGGAQATVFSYPIADGKKRGIVHLAEEVEASADEEPLRCIVAGGDGTVMWAIEQIFQSQIPISRVVIGTIPFGTGNDFGGVTMWGNAGPSKGFLREKDNFSGLNKFVQAWLRATSHPYDIWEISVRTRRSGNAGFQFIEDKKKQCTDEHISRHGIQTLSGGELEMSKFICNYVSFGLDARVGIGFDKLRQKNRILNKGVYAWEGAKKMLFKKKGVIGHIIQSMTKVKEDSIVSARDGHDRELAPDSETIFSTAPDGSPKLAGNPVSLIFLNIPSIAGGLDVWNWSNRRLGTSSGNKELLKRPQDFGDGFLECLAYRTSLGFYAEQTRTPPFRGQGHRVSSSSGPVRLSFRDPSDSEYLKGTSHCKGRTYMQVDGEFIIVHEPDTVVIKHHATISVLIGEPPSCCC